MAEYPKTTLPNPMASDSVKQSKQWQEDSLDAVINECIYTTNRKSTSEINELYDIVDGIVTRDSLKKAINPLGVEDYDDEDWMFEGDKNYSVLNGVVKTLIGEELKRPFEVKALVLNPDAVTRKELMIKEKIDKRLLELVQGEDDEQNTETELRRLKQWSIYSAQDASERMANQIINYLTKELDLRRVFKNGFKDKVIVDTEVYYVGENGNEPHIRKCDPRNIYAVGMGEDSDLSQADKVLEVFWLSIGEAVARYGKMLSKKEVKDLIGIQEAGTQYRQSKLVEETRTMFTTDDDYNASIINGGMYDYKGNVKVYRAVWKSYTEVLEIEYLDEDGNAQRKFRHKNYEVNIDLGEKIIEKIPIPEYFEGVRIGDKMYAYIKPREIQMRSLDNPAICKSPYVGKFGLNSVVDDLLPWAIDYIVYAKKLKELWVSNIGKVAKIDISRIPRGEGWDLNRWLKWARKFRFIIEDSFQTDAKGNIAGNMQQNSGYLDLGLGNEIQQVVIQLEYIEEMIERRSGVSRQRQGDVKASDGLGTTQQAILQSAHQTEELFFEHEKVKRDVLEVLVATTQWLWSDKSVKKQFVLDDLTLATLDVIGADFAQDQIGIVLTDGSKGAQLEQVFTNLAHAAMQTGSISLSDVADVYMSPSPSTMINKLKAAEQEGHQRLQEQQKQQQEAVAALQQEEQAFEMQKLQIEYDFKFKELEMKMQLEGLKLHQSELGRIQGLDNDNDGTDDTVEIDKVQMTNAQKKYEADLKAKIERERMNLDRSKINTEVSENAKDRSLQRSIANSKKVN